MQTTAHSALTPAPFTSRPKTVALPPVTRESIVRYARIASLQDFARKKTYAERLDHIKQHGEDITIVPLREGADPLVKTSSTRMLKEHTSVSRSMYLYQWSLFGLTGAFTVSSALGFYLTIYHNRAFLPVGPITGAAAWQVWKMLENTWEQQRYVDYAAKMRDHRQGNPANEVIKRRRKMNGAEGTDSADGPKLTEADAL